MSPIANALALGYGAPQVLGFITRAFPSLAPRIKKAQTTGYSVEKILKLLNRGMGGGDELDNLTESQIHTQRDKKQNDLSQDLLKMGAGAAATYGASKVIPGLIQKGVQSLGLSGQKNPLPPQSPSQSSIGPKPMSNAPVHTSPIPSAPPSQPNLAVAAVAPPVTSVPSVNPKASTQILQEMGLEDRIKNLLKAGNPKETVAQVLESTLAPHQKKWLGEKIKSGEAKPIQEMVNDYLGDSSSQAQQLEPQIQTNEQQPIQKLDQAPTASEAPKKGDLVFDPKSGISGDLKDVRKKEALIDDEGKIHKVKVEDVINSPIDKKELADLFDDLNKGIEQETGEQVSRSVRMLAYHPETNTLLFVPWNGVPYAYDDIDDEERDFLKNHLQKRRTTGESLIGAWSEGTKSVMGSKMYDFIKGLQAKRGGKGKEYSAKFDVIYDPHKHAIEAKKNKMRKQK